MRKAPEPRDDVTMLVRRGGEIGIAGRGLEQHRAILIGENFAVLKRHVEEVALDRLKLVVELGIDRQAGDRQCELIGRILIGVAANMLRGN